MVPAVKAAIATGVVDAKKVGITGHSWGGYQTSFLVTQTDIFAAAVAGAPLTNMVSMYSLIYKNSGGGNMAIFESSQGRFKGGYLDNWDAYYRNSPVFFAKNVKTPLMILHNDKDGAVDFTQGVEYYNTLRRLGKPVIMLEYVGENHGLARRPNQRDYTARMKEYFDHYLKGAPAPDWMLNGVPRLKMEDHLKERNKKADPAPKKITTDRAASRFGASGRTVCSTARARSHREPAAQCAGGVPHLITAPRALTWYIVAELQALGWADVCSRRLRYLRGRQPRSSRTHLPPTAVAPRRDRKHYCGAVGDLEADGLVRLVGRRERHPASHLGAHSGDDAVEAKRLPHGLLGRGVKFADRRRVLDRHAGAEVSRRQPPRARPQKGTAPPARPTTAEDYDACGLLRARPARPSGHRGACRVYLPGTRAAWPSAGAPAVARRRFGREPLLVPGGLHADGRARRAALGGRCEGLFRSVDAKVRPQLAAEKATWQRVVTAAHRLRPVVLLTLPRAGRRPDRHVKRDAREGKSRPA